MKFNWKLSVLTTVLAFAGYQTVNAQTTAYTISDNSVRYAPTSYYQEGEAAAPAVAPEADLGCTDLDCCDSGCESACGSECEEWKLFDLNDGCRKLNVGGWINGGITLAGRNVPTTAPIAFVNPIDQVLGNQAWVYVERDADTGGCGFDYGYRMDYVFGADGPDTQAFGDNSWDASWDTNANYGSAIPQLYAEVAYNNLSIKAGHFFTLIGYEVVPATGNFFYSHAYTMNYGEPFTHTGAIGEYAVNDNVTAYGGYTFGWDTGFENLLDAHTFLGGLSLQLSDVSKLTWMVTTGAFGDGTGNNGFAAANGNIYMQSIVYSRNLSDNLEYVFQTDYGTNTGIGGTGNEWYGANQYLFYTLNDCWKAGARYEIFRDQAGAGQTGRVGNGVEEYQAATLGLNYTPTKNFTVRPETRWDWVENGTGAFGGNNSLFTFGIDAIFTF